MAFSRPLFTITRPQTGRVVPLIPADLLPEGIIVGGYPRSLTPQEMIGTVDLGVVDSWDGGAQPNLQLCIMPEDPSDGHKMHPLSRADSLGKDIRDLLNDSSGRSCASDQNPHAPDEGCSTQGLVAELEADAHLDQTKSGTASSTSKRRKSRRKPIHKGRRARMASVAKRETSAGEQVLQATPSATPTGEVHEYKACDIPPPPNQQTSSALGLEDHSHRRHMVQASEVEGLPFEHNGNEPDARITTAVGGDRIEEAREGSTGNPRFLRSQSSAESKTSEMKPAPTPTIQAQDENRAPLAQEEPGEKDTAAAPATSSSIQEEELLIEL
ncbi:uncharacterized protein F5Z01DRAFT_310359 [Emericellopsis atlantica]|uniref:Uncharacterized protein n=1 Tax=Emericellopsis atlantica TaxID=2614577 RepID=A0A9P8CSL1_9HYPO|nr:uncharacterized protein F5Z01DRAFT_310359 [Emericellopsis atlantica]KAG9257938.1 hypothetical protein F5Z01DRAFT_310359 [Emericellopsis atlantica]